MNLWLQWGGVVAGDFVRNKNLYMRNYAEEANSGSTMKGKH